MTRNILLGLFAVPLAGCASTWDTVSNRQFQSDFANNPYKAMFVSDDPMTVLRTNPDGSARAKAMRRMEEPATHGHPEEQAEALQYLSDAATIETSPVVRAAAIEALGKFKDPNVLPILKAAYAQSSGNKSVEQAMQRTMNPAAPGLLSDRSGLFGPTGYPPEVVVLLKSRTIEAMARTGQPEAYAFIADIAKTQEDPKNPNIIDRDVRLAAVKSLSQIRTSESATLLAQVMMTESNRDTAIANRAREGLVELTGHNYPVGSTEWNGVMQAGFTVRPEPNLIERAVGWLTP
ncbi:MAG: HEAT repeat domain-containing protein [Gemmataceae bacterium]